MISLFKLGKSYKRDIGAESLFISKHFLLSLNHLYLGTDSYNAGSSIVGGNADVGGGVNSSSGHGHDAFSGGSRHSAVPYAGDSAFVQPNEAYVFTTVHLSLLFYFLFCFYMS